MQHPANDPKSNVDDSGTSLVVQDATVSQIATVAERAEIVVWDRTHPLAVLNVVPPALGDKFEAAAKAKPQLFGMDERELFKTLRNDNATPSPTDNRLRLKFWLENDRIMGQGYGKMNISNVTSNVCSREYFEANFLSNPGKVAWLLTPPSDYTTKAKEALDFALDQLRDILEQPHMVGGRVDLKLAGLKAKIAGMLEDRVRGAVVQKVVNLNASTSDVRTVNRVAQAMTEETLDAKLKELERRNRRALHVPENPS